MKTALFFGIYDPEYSRNRVLMDGFKGNDWAVAECKVDPRKHRGFGKYILLVSERFKLFGKAGSHPDIVIVAFPGQTVIWLARILFPRTRIVFDAFTSLYDSNVSDRGLYCAKSFRGRLDYFLDWQALILADVVITDTVEDSKYLRETFKASKEIIPVFVGSAVGGHFDPDIPSDHRALNDAMDGGPKFIVHFHGSFIPLQGIEHIIRAGKLLEPDKDVVFRMIGGGQEYGRIRALESKINGGHPAANILFLPRMPFGDLMKNLGEASVSLGIFGVGDKARRVIPNKIYEALALGKAVVTADSPACRELLKDGENVIFCKAGDPADLAEKIKRLKSDKALLERVANGGRKLFYSKLQPAGIVGRLIAGL